MNVDRIVREPERRQITGRSPASWWRDERDNKAPRRIRIGDNAVGWRLSELLEWVESRQFAEPRQVAVPAPGKQRGRKRKQATL